MLLAEVIPVLQLYWPILLPLLLLTYLLRNKYRKGLNKYPGPFLASYTNWWRFFENLGRHTERTFIDLHRKYGDVVRVGPNVLSFADPRALKVIYGLNKGFVKTDFYIIQQGVSKGERLPSLFSTTDESYHAKYRRCVNSAFAMTSLVNYEPLVDSTTRVFLQQTEKLFAKTGAVCNFSRWLQYYAFDVIGELTWSKRLGFVEQNKDVDGIVKFIGDFLSYAGPIGQMPILDLFLEKNPIRLWLQRKGLENKDFAVTAFAKSRSAERADEMAVVREKGLAAITDDEKATSRNAKGVDLLTRFTAAQHEHPEFMTDKQVLITCQSMVFAGSETTAISLSAVFYYLLHNPRAYKKLMEELDGAVQSGEISNREQGLVTWAESQKLPYLDAVIQEAFRLYPAAGLLLERIVPPQGVNICGEQIPGGTIVGCNAWVLHRRPEIFGEDVDTFRPERWLEASPDKLKEMKSTMFQFGAGARTCIGKNISLLEMYKLVPAFLMRFEISIRNPERPWKTHCAWFVRQDDFEVTFKPRGRPETA